MVKECPEEPDVQQLTTKQQEELMENLNILKDIETHQQLESVNSESIDSNRNE